MPIFRTGSAASENYAGHLDAGLPYHELKSEIVSEINQEIATGTYDPSAWSSVVANADNPVVAPHLYPALKDKAAGPDTSWSGNEWGGFFGGLAKLVGAGTSGAADIVHGPNQPGLPPGQILAGQAGYVIPEKSFPWPLVILGAGGLGMVLLMSRGSSKKKED